MHQCRSSSGLWQHIDRDTCRQPDSAPEHNRSLYESAVTHTATDSRTADEDCGSGSAHCLAPHTSLVPPLCLLCGPNDHKKLLDAPAKDVGPGQGLLGRGSIFDIRLAASFAMKSISLNSCQPLSRCELWTLNINPILTFLSPKTFFPSCSVLST